MKCRSLLILVWIAVSTLLLHFSARAQYNTAGIDVEDSKSVEAKSVVFSVSPDKRNCIYKLGDDVVFTIKLFIDGKAVRQADMSYTIGPEKMEAIQEWRVQLQDGYAKLIGKSMDKAGVLRCDVRARVKDKIHRAVATVAFAPEEIKPTATTPQDFDAFWVGAIEEARGVPLNSKLTPIPDKSDDLVAVYQVAYEFYSDGIQKFYGVLSMPREQGKFPAIVRFPGAGWLPLSGDQRTAEKGFITLDLYIHGRPVTKDKSYYVDLQNNELKAYQYKGIAHRDSFYYKNVVLGCVRSIDLIYSLPEFDGKRVGVWGSSQGGALSLITSSLENRINYTVALCPAMCDFTGYSNNRAGGWPHLFTRPELYEDRKDQVMETLSYYDVVNFAKRLKAPVFFSWGFNDPSTPSTSIYAAYNVIEAPKQQYIIPEGVHKVYPKQRIDTYAWLVKNLRTEKQL